VVSSLSPSLSGRVLDCFLCEGREVIFRLALALLLNARAELLQKDIEGVTKVYRWKYFTELTCVFQYFQHEMPGRLEAEQEAVFTSAFSFTINQRQLKRIERDYLRCCCDKQCSW